MDEMSEFKHFKFSLDPNFWYTLMERRFAVVEINARLKSTATFYRTIDFVAGEYGLRHTNNAVGMNPFK